MRSGSGTNLKVATYLGAGLPVVTTPHGARGYDLTDGIDAVVCDLSEFATRLTALLDDSTCADRIGRAGRALVATHYDWSGIAERVRPRLVALAARGTVPEATAPAS